MEVPKRCPFPALPHPILSPLAMNSAHGIVHSDRLSVEVPAVPVFCLFLFVWFGGMFVPYFAIDPPMRALS